MNDPSLQGLAAAYAEHRANLLRFLTARTGQRADAEELLQEVWLKIDGARTGPIGDARAYLYRVAQNLVLDRLREVKRRAARERDWADVTLDQRADAPEPVAPADAETALIAAGEAQRLADAIAKLPPGAAAPSACTNWTGSAMLRSPRKWASAARASKAIWPRPWLTCVACSPNGI